MAKFKNDPFPGTDYTRYLEWKKVVTPDGQTYYEVPGHPGYVFDPVASSATGDKVFRQNPQREISKQQEAEKTQAELIKQDQFNKSPTGQLLPIAGGTLGTIAAYQAMKPGQSALDKYIEAKLAKEAGIDLTGGSGAGGGGAGAAQTPAQAAASGATSGGAQVPIGQNADGSYIYATETNVLPPGAEIAEDGSIIDAQTGATIGRVAQGAMGAYQLYTGMQRFKDDKIGGALDIASGGANVASALGYTQAAPYAAPLMAASGAYNVYNSLQNGGEGIRGSAATLGAGIGTMILPGIGTVAGAVIGNAAGYGLDKLGIAHKTTRQRARETTGKYIEEAGDDQNALNYVNQVRAQYEAPPPDPSKPYLNGTYGSFDEYKKAGLVASDLAHVEGNFNTYGVKEWSNLTQAQREAVTQANINSGLYRASKGQVLIDDAATAKKNFDDVISGKVQPSNTNAPVSNPKQALGAPAGFQAPSPVAQAAAVGATKLPGNLQSAYSLKPGETLPARMQSVYPGSRLPTSMPDNPNVFGNIPHQKLDPILPNGQPRDPNDPNRYWIDDQGRMMGTLIGYTPAGKPQPNINTYLPGLGAQISGGAMGSPIPLPSGIVAPLQPAQIAAQAAMKPVNNPNSPGFRNGVRINYGR